MLQDKTYRLVDDSFITYFISAGRSNKLLVFDDSHKNASNHKNRAIRHCPNESSVFVDEQSSLAVVEPLLFQNKLLEVKANQTITQKFLDIHPHNVINGGTYFELVDSSREAAIEIESEDLILELKHAVKTKEKEPNGAFELEALTAVIMGSVASAKNMSISEMKREIYAAIEFNPENFTDVNGNPNLFDNSSYTRLYLALRAISEGIVIVSSDNKTISWANKTSITAVPRGIKPAEFFAEFLETDDGLIVLKEIDKRLS